MKEIKVGSMVALVDDEDFDRVNQFTWGVDGAGYVYTWIKKRETIRLHRFVTDYYGRQHVDHLDNNTLNNCKSNLRIVSSSENQLNRAKEKQSNNKSGTTGVRYNPAQGWEAYIQRHGRKRHLGTFPNKELAVEARKEAEIQWRVKNE